MTDSKKRVRIEAGDDGRSVTYYMAEPELWEALLEDYTDCLYCPQYFQAHATRVNFWYLIRSQLLAMNSEALQRQYAAWVDMMAQAWNEQMIMSGYITKGGK